MKYLLIVCSLLVVKYGLPTIAVVVIRGKYDWVSGINNCNAIRAETRKQRCVCWRQGLTFMSRDGFSSYCMKMTDLPGYTVRLSKRRVLASVLTKSNTSIQMYAPCTSVKDIYLWNMDIGSTQKGRWELMPETMQRTFKLVVHNVSNKTISISELDLTLWRGHLIKLTFRGCSSLLYTLLKVKGSRRYPYDVITFVNKVSIGIQNTKTTSYPMAFPPNIPPKNKRILISIVISFIVIIIILSTALIYFKCKKQNINSSVSLHRKPVAHPREGETFSEQDRRNRTGWYLTPQDEYTVINDPVRPSQSTYEVADPIYAEVDYEHMSSNFIPPYILTSYEDRSTNEPSDTTCNIYDVVEENNEDHQYWELDKSEMTSIHTLRSVESRMLESGQTSVAPVGEPHYWELHKRDSQYP